MRISDWSSDVCSSDLDLDQRVEDHRPAIVEINLENVVAGIFARIGIVAVDLETLHARRIAARLVLLALPDDAVLGQGELGHCQISREVRIDSLARINRRAFSGRCSRYRR